MLDAVRAEALKLHRHRATWLMVWIFPILGALIVAGIVAYTAFKAPGAAETGKTAAKWISDSALLWQFPGSAPGRFLMAGFAAVVFAGEYGWNTWKLIIPARARWQLIAAKWVVALGFLLIALLAAVLIGLFGDWLLTFFGEAIPAGVTLSALAEAHLRAAGNALWPIVYTLAFAGMFAILTQSILATVILSIALVVLEGLLPITALFAFSYAPGLVPAVVKVLPFFHLLNLGAWAKEAGLVLPLAPGTVIAMSWGASAAALSAWIVAAGAVTQLRFARQDLN